MSDETSAININKAELLEKAANFKANGQLPEAEQIYVQILQAEPTNPDALINMAIIANLCKKYDLGIMYANEATKIKPNDEQPINIMGLSFLNKEEYEKALICFKKSSQINPNSYHPHHNMGIALGKLKRTKEAIEEYKRAIEINPKMGDSINNLANIYQRLGNIEGSLKLYIKSLPSTSDKITVIYNIAWQLFFLKEYTKLREFILEISQSKYLSEYQAIGLNIINSIAYIIADDYKTAEQLLKKVGDVPLNEETFPQHNTLSIYFTYLNQLIEYRNSNPTIYPPKHKDKIYIVGESHCLSPAFTEVKLKGKPHTCIPKFVLGAQARSISANESNHHKSILDYAINDIPKNSTVVFMFGEIDCRIEYGILPYHKKIKKLDNKSIDTTIKDITNSYVEYSIKVAKKIECTLILYGVPTTNIKESNYNKEDIDLIKFIIHNFNKHLKDAAKKNNVPFIDIYEETRTKDSMASGEQHIDETHLYPHIFSQVIDKYAN